MTTPTHQEIIKHFEKAKEIKCLDLDIVVNINHVSSFNYDVASGNYYASNGLICVWNSKKGYAPITKKKCNKGECKKCNCK